MLTDFCDHLASRLRRLFRGHRPIHQTASYAVGMAMAMILVHSVQAGETEGAGQGLPPLVLVGTEETENTFHGRWLRLIYTEAFRRVGYRLEYRGYPAKRASQISDMGAVAGEIHRVEDYGQTHPDLIRVDEPHFFIRFSAYSRTGAVKVTGWADLRDSPYTVGYRRGVKKCETLIPSMKEPSHIEVSNSIAQGLRQVVRGRVTLFIDVERNIEEHLKVSDEFRGSPIVKAGILETVAGHAYLHRRYRSLAPQLAVTLRQMKKEGLIDRFKAEVESR